MNWPRPLRRRNVALRGNSAPRTESERKPDDGWLQQAIQPEKQKDYSKLWQPATTTAAAAARFILAPKRHMDKVGSAASFRSQSEDSDVLVFPGAHKALKHYPGETNSPVSLHNETREWKIIHRNKTENAHPFRKKKSWKGDFIIKFLLVAFLFSPHHVATSIKAELWCLLASHNHVTYM